MTPWPGIKSRASHLIFSWVHCLLDSLNLTHSFLLPLYIHPDLTYFSTLILPIDHRNFSFLPYFLSNIPSPRALNTHIHTLSLTKKSWRRCQECVCCPFDTDSDAILGPWGGQSHGTWHSTTLLLAWRVFLSWHCSGYPGRELVQLLLIPSLCIRTP